MIKTSKIVKMALKSSKMENNLYVIPSLHAKNVVCRSNGVTRGKYKDKEDKCLKSEKCTKNVKNKNLGKRKETLLSMALKKIFPKD